jgi:hypothetical protein
MQCLIRYSIRTPTNLFLLPFPQPFYSDSMFQQHYFTTHLSFKTFFRRASQLSDWGECFDSVEDFRLDNLMVIFVVWQSSCQTNCGIYLLDGIIKSSLWINQSRKTSPGGKFINSFELVSLLGYTTLHYDSSIIADLLKRRMTGISFLWRLLLNIMMTIPACARIQGSTMSQIHA